MRINKVLDYYYKAYGKAVEGREMGRKTLNVFKDATGVERKKKSYNRIKNILFHLFCGPFYWPNTFPTAVDEATMGLLYNIVRLTNPKIAIEIGTAKGNTAISIGQALEDNKKGILHTIDPFEQELVHIAIKKSRLNNRIKYIVDYSQNIIPKLNLTEIDFVFIDGDHSYKSVKRDFNLVKNLVSPGGIIVFHDTMLIDGPKKLIKEIRQNEKDFEIVTLPTLNGSDDTGKGSFIGYNKGKFYPSGITICKKI